MASGSSAGSLVPVASAEGEPLAASAGSALLVALIASGGTVAVSEIAEVAVPALGATFVAPSTGSRFSTSRSTSTSVLMRALSRASSMKCACESNRIVLPSGLTCAKNPSGV